jgi:hypothetical protein
MAFVPPAILSAVCNFCAVVSRLLHKGPLSGRQLEEGFVDQRSGLEGVFLALAHHVPPLKTID